VSHLRSSDLFTSHAKWKLILLLPGEHYRVLPGVVHSFATRKGCAVLKEISSQHMEDDSYRVTSSRQFVLGDQTMKKLIGCLEDFRAQHILVIGDVMLDEYWDGNVSRLSPEAPVPVLSNPIEFAHAGGGGNVAVNITALGGKCTLCAVTGADDEGRRLLQILDDSGVDVENGMVLGNRPTTYKVRLMEGAHHFIRVDKEEISYVDQSIQDIAKAKIQHVINNADAILFADYDKGFITPKLIAFIVAEAEKLHIPIIVDPKERQFRNYNGVNLFKPNLKQLSKIMAKDIVEEATLLSSGQELIRELNLGALLVTRGADGLTIMKSDESFRHYPALLAEVSELSGAGDTVAAVVGLGLAAGWDSFEAARVANIAASLIVRKRGTSVITPLELADALKNT